MMFIEHNNFIPNGSDILENFFFNSINHEHGGFTQIFGAEYVQIRDMRTETNDRVAPSSF